MPLKINLVLWSIYDSVIDQTTALRNLAAANGLSSHKARSFAIKAKVHGRGNERKSGNLAAVSFIALLGK